MNDEEKKLYHQIHPAKLATDWISGALALWLFWEDLFALGFAVLLISAVIATYVVIQYADLEKQRESPFGRYARKHMTKTTEMMRFVGMAVALFGAWYHFIPVLVGGLVLIVLAWLRDPLFSSFFNK